MEPDFQKTIRNAHIDVVDNDPSIVQLIEELLKEANFTRINGFHSGQDVLKAMGSCKPDIILSDIFMPGMDGYELCRLIKEDKRFSRIPIIMITAAPMFDSEPLRKSFESGAVDFISKPISRIELTARVTSSLRLEFQRQELVQALSEVKTLEGLLPICSYCKKIRNDKDYWEEIEAYIQSHSQARFSHGICPDCYNKHIRPEMEEIRKHTGKLYKKKEAVITEFDPPEKK
ncbi:MAG: response regulator [Candidatus Cloacimonetes bacterium]|nr:response regulator [Candidatus Cloacimonadota bacterium]